MVSQTRIQTQTICTNQGHTNPIPVGPTPSANSTLYRTIPCQDTATMKHAANYCV